MKYKLNRPVKMRGAGIIIPFQIFQWGSSPDGIISGKKIQEFGLLEIKYPHNTRNLSIENNISDKNFSIALNNNKKAYSKKGNDLCYYTQIQVAMRLAGLK